MKARIAQLRKAAEDALPYKKHEAVNDLIAIIHASPEQAGPEHPLCEMRMSGDGPYHRFPCKLQAMLLLARLMGWNEPEKVEVDLGVPKKDGLDQLRDFVKTRK